MKTFIAGSACSWQYSGMRRGVGTALATALVTAFSSGAALPAAADIWQATNVTQMQQEVHTAQNIRRERELRGRQRHIQKFKVTPPRRDNDRHPRKRREKPSKTDRDEASDAVRRGEMSSRSRIIGPVRRYCPGTLRSATLRKDGERSAYRVSILRPSGNRVNLLVDAQSGAILSGRCN